MQDAFLFSVSEGVQTNLASVGVPMNLEVLASLVFHQV